MKPFIRAALLIAATGICASAAERYETFDRDPNWDAHNNRARSPAPREVRQDFGYSNTNHCGGEKPGEIGGLVTPTAEPAYYARRISPATLNSRLTAAGTLNCPGRNFHVLLGFFNSETVNEWRTPNTIVIRLYGRGDVFYAYVEYCTSRWRAGGDSPGGFATVSDSENPEKKRLRGFPSQQNHRWSIDYDPAASGGRGKITVSIGEQKAVCELDAGHKADGATFDHFGLLSIPKHYDGGGEVWFDDIAINGEADDFSQDPKWDALGNRRTYLTNSVRPRFDFGFSDTRFAGGAGQGELGGVVFRGDNRYPERMAYYGDRLDPLTLARPLRASGKVGLRRGVSDSTTLIGFFHSKKSVEVSPSQDSGWPVNFFGVAIEGPSREGFLFYPAYRLSAGVDGYKRGDELPHILPDGASHDWSLEYDPDDAQRQGRIVVTFDGKRVVLDLPAGHRQTGAEFDRFGIVTTWIDGNAQRVFFDDIRYTWRQE